MLASRRGSVNFRNYLGDCRPVFLENLRVDGRQAVSGSSARGYNPPAGMMQARDSEGTCSGHLIR